MSNIDRYRPPREGYQPPSLPAKPVPPAISRLSRSPSRRRDVPPAVPSPPTQSSRTSPPRPQSRRAAPSPSQSSPPRAPQARPNQWWFTADEVRSTPSIIDGLSIAEERLRRAKGVNFIYQAGIMLELPQPTLWVAGVFFHRFYMRFSMVEEKGGIHHYNIAATALFLANKSEENCRKTKNLIIAVAKVAQKNIRLVIDEQSKEYWKWRDSILAYEELMLETLTFDLMVDQPYRHLHEMLGHLNLLHNKRIRDAVWAFCNDACLTVLPLMLTARDVAIAAIFFAATTTKEKIDDVQGEPWWRHLRASETNAINAVRLVCEFYKENPLRKQDAKEVPGSPEFNLESTRRRGELSLSQLDLDTSQRGSSVTPLGGGTDRGGTQSPRPAPAVLVNGRADAEDAAPAAKEKEEQQPPEPPSSSVKMEDGPGDSDAALKAAANDLSTHDDRGGGGGGGGGGVNDMPEEGLVSPRVPKRQSQDPEAGDSQDRKRARLEAEREEDMDEGEISE
ncbi:hypothetical protein VTJ49DRAFT_6809 [Mycothermus thermophilus]|uniref:RNA polymerase II holoenzyme cyclin-like subunit n=1 Tax=Humicola insolens TaxID=85995 RepID=A0ABR3VIH7_HUMIN